MSQFSVAELHQKYPHDWDERSWQSGGATFEEALASAGELHLQSDPIAYLEELHETDYGRAVDILKALIFLPPEVVYDYFGHDTVAWISLRAVLEGDNDGINRVLREKGVDTDDLRTARLWVWHHHPHDSTVRRELALYGLMRSMKDGLMDEIDLPAVLNESANPGVTLNPKRLGDYALAAIHPDEYNYYYSGGRVRTWTNTDVHTADYPIWLDAPTGFVLTYKDAPQAVGALSMSSERDMMIHQIQGVKGKRIDTTKHYYDEGYYASDISARGLAPLDWRKAIVRVAEHAAKMQGAERMAIEAGINNAWVKKRGNDKEPHISMEVAEQIYDGTARRLGYTRANHDDWYKILE